MAMTTTPTLCPQCQEPADGLDGTHCQLHWEALCALSWWAILATAEEQEEP